MTSACDIAVVYWSKHCIGNSEDLKVIAFVFVSLTSWHDSEATQWTLGGGGHGMSECRAACHAQAAVNMFFNVAAFLLRIIQSCSGTNTRRCTSANILEICNLLDL